MATTSFNLTVDGTLSTSGNVSNTGVSTFTSGTANSPAISATGNGTGAAVQATVATNATATGFQAICNNTAPSGILVTGDPGSAAVVLGTTNPALEFRPGNLGTSTFINVDANPAADVVINIPDPGKALVNMITNPGRVLTYNNAGHADLTIAESGAIIFVQQDGAYTINVPNPAAANSGVQYTFIVSTSNANAVTINTVTANQSVFNAVIVSDATATAAAVDQNTITIVATAGVGTQLHLVSNGARWIGRGYAVTASKITCP